MSAVSANLLDRAWRRVHEVAAWPEGVARDLAVRQEVITYADLVSKAPRPVLALHHLRQLVAALTGRS